MKYLIILFGFPPDGLGNNNNNNTNNITSLFQDHLWTQLCGLKKAQMIFACDPCCVLFYASHEGAWVYLVVAAELQNKYMSS